MKLWKQNFCKKSSIYHVENNYFNSFAYKLNRSYLVSKEKDFLNTLNNQISEINFKVNSRQESIKQSKFNKKRVSVDVNNYNYKMINFTNIKYLIISIFMYSKIKLTKSTRSSKCFSHSLNSVFMGSNIHDRDTRNFSNSSF